MRTMYDAVTPRNIPASALLVAGYADGHYANVPALHSRFPHAKVVTIAVAHGTRAMVADVETGDLSPATAVQWARDTMHDVPNGELTIYANTSTWPSVVAAFKAAHVSLPQWWAAHYTGVPHLEPGSIATQYADTGGYDLSWVADYWPGVDGPAKSSSPAPSKPAPSPKASSYTVVAGDTLSGIAAKHGLTLGQIEALNPQIHNPALIVPGEIVHLEPGSAAASTYTVRSGDTLSAIATAHNTTWQHLATLNHLANPNLILPGLVLHLK